MPLETDIQIADSVVTNVKAVKKNYPVSVEADTFHYSITPKEVSIKEFFGEEAVVVEYPTNQSVTDRAELVPLGYDIAAVIIMFVVYMIMLARYKHLIPTVIKAKFYGYTTRMLLESLDVNIVKLTGLSIFLLLMSLSMALSVIVRTYDLVAMPDAVSEHLLPLSMGVVLLVTLWRRLIVRIIRSFSRAKGFFEMLDFSERLTFAFWGFWMAPVVVACVFASSDFHSVERYLIMGTVAAMVLHHIIELTKLFIRQRVSFLQYILYLCTVELLPISFIVTVLQKLGTL